MPAPIEQIPLFVRAGAILPLNGDETVTLAGVPAADLLRNLELRVYPAGTDVAEEPAVAFHDGSTVRLGEAPRRLSLAFGATPAARRYTVRLPAPFGGGGGETTIDIPAGMTQFEIDLADRP